mgnify:FL=1
MPEMEIDTSSSAIWHLLLDHGKASEEALNEVYEEHERTGRAFTTVLYNYDIITEQELLELIAENLGTQVVDLKEVNIPHDVAKKIGASTARMYGIIPVREEDGVMHLAAKDPMNYRMLDELHYVIGQDCRILVASPSQIDDALDYFYPRDSDSVSDVLAELEGEFETETEEQDLDDAQALEEVASNAPIVRFVDVVLYQAIKDRASDIHFEPFVNEFKIRYRIDGALYEMAPPPKHLAVPVISRIKVLSNLNIAERRKPQDGRIELRIAGRPIDLRVSTLPTQYGESVVLRVLDRSNVQLDLEKIGMDAKDLENIRHLIKQPNGILIVTGPTGSGKTTTLYSALREINTVEEKLLTAEDPVEYNLDGIMQLGVKEDIDLTFANALRAFLRQDPDRIMVGEIRDYDTAAMAVQASLTGHLVLSTLHTNDAAGAVTRLIDMGVEPFLISSTLIGILAQRLIRRVCTECRKAYVPEDQELELLGLDRESIGDRQFYYGKGCETCNHTGYRGRVGIFELLPITTAIQEMINESLPTRDIRNQAIEEGMTLLRQSGIRKILDGVSTVEEVLQYT